METEKQFRLQILNQKPDKTSDFEQNFVVLSDFALKNLQHVRFWTETFSFLSGQILKSTSFQEIRFRD